VRLLGWIVIVFAACALQHARLAGWPVAPDLPLALAAWAVVCGDPRAWMWRVWLIGPIRDAADPGSVWFYAAAQLLLVIAAIPLRRWIFVTPWVALAAVGCGMALAVQAIDILVSGVGGWSSWRGVVDALLTGAAAVAMGWLVPAPKRTVALDPADEPQAPATEAE
jgi:hypothetical protein